MNVLICSQYGEHQVNDVCKKIIELGGKPVIFERYRKDQFISYHFSPEASAVLRIGDEEYPLTAEVFPVVWYRPKPIILGEIPGETAKIKERFCIQEWRAILQSLDIFLEKSKWVNPILSSQQASNKPFQLKLAHEMGLKIPSTVITNDATKALELFNQRVIYKTLSSFCTSSQAIYTNELYAEQVINCQQEIAMAPGIFQNLVEKKYELRVTVIGDKVFAIKINSQNYKDNMIDWRRKHNQSMYELGELSNKTAESLLSFHKHLGLTYAAYDFIVNDKEEEIFLECNPSGQWLWLEEIVDINISQAMASELLLN
jgi:hypothetical protein